MRKPIRTETMNARKHAGVTLMELMVIIVILGTLAAIGIPTYRQYMLRTHRTEAKSALLRLAAEQERFYLQNNTYTNNFVALNMPAGRSENGVYTLAIPVANVTTYTLTATPTAGGGTNGVNQTPDAECVTFTINQAGIRTAAPDPNGRCW